jgi:uncharacterized protein YjiS (DUF1127 family)
MRTQNITFGFTGGHAGANSRRFAWRTALTSLLQAYRVAASRRDLAEADDRTLADLGISRAQARFEASRAPWDLGRRGW